MQDVRNPGRRINSFGTATEPTGINSLFIGCRHPFAIAVFAWRTFFSLSSSGYGDTGLPSGFYRDPRRAETPTVIATLESERLRCGKPAPRSL